MRHIVIKNANIVNEGVVKHGDMLISGNRIEKIASNISISINRAYKEINADNLCLIPGMIDAHVHFREPGYPRKGNISSESTAAIAGGITSFMDMPNTLPSVLSKDLLDDKFKLASASSVCNYSFFMGLTKDNLEDALRTSKEDVCGLTDDGLYFDDKQGLLCNNPEYLEKLFSRTDHLVALHSENESIIKKNLEKYQSEFGELIPPRYHHLIRSEESCLQSTIELIDLAKKHNSRMHLLHISTASESNLFSNEQEIIDKRITSETCLHYLFFNESDHQAYANLIKWNPSIKTKRDQMGLMQAVSENRIDIIATDHAPHSFYEKTGNYLDAKSGAPMVQHALPALFELYHSGMISLEKIVQKTSHAVADSYRVMERGYLREGYYADVVLIDLNSPWTVSPTNILYGCNWSPMLNHSFRGKIKTVIVNGNLVFENSTLTKAPLGMQLKFEKNR